jgi:glycosyltransferase involved in cell wall biosynthesis
MARNEMPLLPLTVANLLNQGVDQILIADHGSTDGTSDWLNAARRLDDRIAVIRHSTLGMYQSAVISCLARLATAMGATWIIPFDCDELWVPSDRSLHLSDVIEQLEAQGIDAIPVTMRNFAPPVDCEEFELRTVPHFTHRFQAGEVHDLDDLSAFKLGTRSFLSCAYRDDKWLVKAHPNVLIAAGAHTVPSLGRDTGHDESAPVRCLHLPLRSRQHLRSKSDHGAMLCTSGFPISHGWQHQLINAMGPEEATGRFWEGNSCTIDGAVANVASTELLIADASLGEVYAELAGHPLLNVTHADGGSAEHSSDDLASLWLGVSESFARDAELANAARTMSQAALNELDGRYTALEGTYTALEGGMAALEGRYAAAVEQLRVSRAEVEAITGSKSWRFTAWVRWLALMIRLRRRKTTHRRWTTQRGTLPER